MSAVISETAAQIQTPRQRWSNIFTIAYAALAILIAMQLRSATENATVVFSDPVVGLTVQYPQNWLLDTSGASVLTVSDQSADGFKTSIEVQVLPLGVGLSERNIVDDLILRRSQSLASFDVLERSTATLGENEQPATSMTFTYVSGEQNPFLESLPTVVEGIDVITTQGGQALIVTLRSDVRSFDESLPIFQRFLNDLDF